MVEVNAKYIKGMINNPNIQPSATTNCWIAGILLFNFKLQYVPTKDHASADGLSCQPHAEADHNDWIDKAYSFAMECLNMAAQGSSKNILLTAGHSCVTSPCKLISTFTTTMPLIPWNSKAQACYKQVLCIQPFLLHLECPSRLMDQEYT